jgi:glycosyltransferase involved in cell wall biosynthesis
MKIVIGTLICVYAGDSPALIREALYSVLNQKLSTNVEHRIYLGVDGPVPAAIQELVEDVRHACHLIYQSTHNQGLARTLNALLASLTDEQFVFRMDADDVSLPQRYQTQLDYLARHPEIDVLGTAITELDAGSGAQRVVTFCRGPQSAIENIHKGVPVAHPTVCIRRRVFDALGGYPVVGTNEDIALWFKCIRQGFSFDSLSGPLLIFRVSSSFWRRRSVRKSFSELMCYWRGIYAMRGLGTVQYLYPLARFMIRLAPLWVSRFLYASPLRGRIRGS